MPTSPSLEGSIEPHEVSKRQLQIASLNGQASSNGKTCKGEIRTVEDGSIEWKDGDQWSKFGPSRRGRSISLCELTS